MAGVKSLPIDPPESNHPNDPAPMDEGALRSSHPALRSAVISIGRGWYGLVSELFEQLPRDVVASQVTEKDGELQVLLVGHPDGSDEALWRAAELSRYTCAVCGEPGEVIARRGWLKAVCDLHAAAWTFDSAIPG
jgi:hypothetical protein